MPVSTLPKNTGLPPSPRALWPLVNQSGGYSGPLHDCQRRTQQAPPCPDPSTHIGYDAWRMAISDWELEYFEETEFERPEVYGLRVDAFQQDREFVEDHLANCNWCPSPINHPRVVVRASGKVAKIQDPMRNPRFLDLHEGYIPDPLPKLPPALYDVVGLDWLWLRHPFALDKSTGKTRILDGIEEEWHEPADPDEVTFWESKRAIMSEFLATHPEMRDKYLRLPAASQDPESLAHHFASCPGDCQPWQTINLHKPFRRAPARSNPPGSNPMSLPSTIRDLESSGIEIPSHVLNALGVISAAHNSRGRTTDAAAELSSALISGSLTADTFDSHLRDACVRQLTSQTGAHGALAWQAALAVERVAETQVRGFLATQLDTVLDRFSPEIDRHAKTLADNLGKAAPPGATHEEVIAAGPKGPAAGKAVSEAEANLSNLVAFLRNIAAEAGEPLPFGRFLDPGDDVLPSETGIWADYLRAGSKIGIISEDRMREVEENGARIAHEQAADIWRPRIAEEARRLVALRGLQPRWVLEVPEEFAYLINEAADDLELPERSRPRSRRIQVIG
jgi:hypothetical protein